MLAFVKLREMLSAHKDLARKLADMERKYDSQFRVVFDAIRQLMAPSENRMKVVAGFGKGKDALVCRLHTRMGKLSSITEATGDVPGFSTMSSMGYYF